MGILAKAKSFWQKICLLNDEILVVLGEKR